MSGPPTRRVLLDRYERRREAVVTGAAKVFADRGYDQTSVADLGQELGLAGGSMYHYFGSKEDLLMTICSQLTDPLLERARELVAEPRDSDDRLRALVRLWVANVVELRDHMLVFQQERHVIERSPAWRQVRLRRKSFERLVEDVLHRARPDCTLDDRLVLSALLGMVNHTAQWYCPRRSPTPVQIADGYVDLLLRRVGAGTT